MMPTYWHRNPLMPVQAQPGTVAYNNSPAGMAQQAAVFGQKIPGVDYAAGQTPTQNQLNQAGGITGYPMGNNMFPGNLNPQYSAALWGDNAKQDDGRPGSPSWAAAQQQQMMQQRQMAMQRRAARRGINPGQLMFNQNPGIVNTGVQ